MKPSLRLLKKLTAALLILIIITAVVFVISKRGGANIFNKLNKGLSDVVYNKISSYIQSMEAGSPKKTISVKKDAKETSSQCLEKESLKNAKNCTLLVGDVEKHGTGFVVNINSFVNSDNDLAGYGSYLITNYHVIDHYNQGYADIYYNEQFNSSRIAGFSVEDDLAVVKLNHDLPPCNWSDSQNLDLAENVYAVGWPNSPFGESTITKGVFSRYVTLGDDDIKMIQTDTPINPGNSGGPLINKCGVVGINTSKVSWIDETAPSEGIGYAISSNHAQKIITQIIKNDDGSAKIPTKKISRLQPENSAAQPDSNQQNNVDYLDPNSLVSYDYEQVLFWEDQKIKNEARLKSWQKAEDSEFINEKAYNSLIDKINRSLEIAEILWDGYTNSKITYLDVLNLKQEYFVLSKEIIYLSNELNLQGSINAYKNCVDSWKDLEKEYNKDFSKQIDKCEEILEFE